MTRKEGGKQQCQHPRKFNPNYAQAKIVDMPSRLAIPLAVRTAVKKERSLTLFDSWRATVMACVVCPFSSPYLTSTYLLASGNLSW